MTLREIYTYLEDIALTVPDVRTVVENDVLKINEMREIEYGVFAITQNSHASEEGWMNYNLNLFYIDRLMNSQDNEVQIQSHGIEMLRQILAVAGDGDVEVESGQYNTFTQRFQDLCAGAWVTVNIRTPEGICTEI